MLIPGGIFIGRFKKRVARKFHIIIVLHFGLLTFLYHFGKTRQPLIFMVFRLGGSVHDSQHQLCIILETPIYSTSFSANHAPFLENDISVFFLEIDKFEDIGEDGDRQILKIRLIDSWKSWVWGQYV